MWAAAPGDTITFDPSLTGQTIILTQGELFIDKDLTIAGLGQAQLTINGNQASRVFFVNWGITATIQDVTISGGFTFGPGGGIYNSGTLTLSHCTLSGNSAGLSGMTHERRLALAEQHYRTTRELRQCGFAVRSVDLRPETATQSLRYENQNSHLFGRAGHDCRRRRR
jgi:hypothetical protein